jgi:hypothetical protein
VQAEFRLFIFTTQGWVEPGRSATSNWIWPMPLTNYSYRSASIGSSREAFQAG